MAIFVAAFTYDASPESLAAARPARHAYFAQLERDGRLLASGQLLDGALGDGMLVLVADDERDARTLLADDPYARKGYLARLDLAAWRPTSGTWVTQ